LARGDRRIAGTEIAAVTFASPGAERCRIVRRMSTPANELSNAEKRTLKARAQGLEPVVKLGHAGLSDAFVRSMDAALTLHGLVKMKFSDFKDQKHDLAPQIAEKTASTLVMQVGNVAVFYRAKPAAEETKDK
jgi:RNA-binding protein